MRPAAIPTLLLLAISAVGTRGATELERHSVAEVEAMIVAADPGATIRVPRGVYTGNLVIRKAISLDGSDGAVFDGQGKGTVIEIRAEHVTIRACSIRASGDDVSSEPAGVLVAAGAATVESNTIEDTLFGIDLRESPDSIVRGNTIAGKQLEPGRRGDGIRFWWSHRGIIEDNTIRGSRDMVFWYSEDLQVARNRVADSRYGLHFMYSHHTVLSENVLTDNSVGIYLMYSNSITLKNNRLTNNRGASGYGIGLKDCDDIVITGNTLLANRVGMYIDNSPSAVGSTGLIESNLVAFNEIGLLATPNTHDNVFTANAFVENEDPAATHGRGRLVNNAFSRDRVGNYWTDYAGFDLDADGIGDVEYAPRSLFGAMLATEPNLRLFVHSPAQQAIEFTARALPDLRPEPTLVDSSPLALPPDIAVASVGIPRHRLHMGLLAAGLCSLAGLCVAVLGGGRAFARQHTGDRT